MDTTKGSDEHDDRDQRPSPGQRRASAALTVISPSKAIADVLMLIAADTGMRAALATIMATRAALYLTESALKIFAERRR